MTCGNNCSPCNDCCDITKDIKCVIQEELQEHYISPALQNCAGVYLTQDTRVLTCDDFDKRHAEDEANIIKLISDLDKEWQKIYNNVKAVRHDDSLVGSGLCGDPLGLNETWMNAMVHSVIYVDQNSIIGEGVEKNPYKVSSSWYNDGFDKTSIKGDRDAANPQERIHVDPDWTIDTARNGIKFDNKTITGAGVDNNPYHVNYNWVNGLFDQNTIKGDCNDDGKVTFHVDQSWFDSNFNPAQIVKDKDTQKFGINDDYIWGLINGNILNGEGAGNVTLSEGDNTPTTYFGGRDKAMGSPVGWLALHGSDYVIPLYKKGA